MLSISLGDLAQTMMLQRRGGELRNEMSVLTEELSSGQVADVKSVLAGNVSYLAGIEGDLKTLDAYEIAAREARQFANATQAGLERIAGIAADYSAQLLTGSNQAGGDVLEQISRDAVSQLASVLSTLNTATGGRAVFAGQDTAGVAVADIDTFMTAFETAVAGATSVADIRTLADDWFTQPTGFATAVYMGSTESLEPFQVSNSDAVSAQTTALNPGITDVLKELALAAVASSGTLALSPERQRDLMQDASDGLINAQGGLIALQANIGSAQERIETIATRQGAERTSLEMARTTLLSADPFETATKLEDVQFRLESLYTVTARMSGLSLVNFIR